MKYELTDETIEVYGRTLHRIKALKNIGTDVKKGDLGGFVESERNLSQKGNCWVFNSAMVYDSAMVFGLAEVYGSAMVCGSAEVYGKAKVYGSAMVFGLAEVYGSAKVYNSAEVYGKAKVYGSAKVYDSAMVYSSAEVYGSVEVHGSAEVCGSAEITKSTDVFAVTPIGSRNDTTTFYKAKGGKIFVKCGCKNTDIDTWLGMVQATHGENKHAKAYQLAAQIARLQISGEEE